MSARLPREEREGFPWYLVTGLILGLLLGLGYAWFLDPVTYADISPEMLQPEAKDQYRRAAALAYRSNGDTGRAAARLALLDDPDPIQALNQQAERILQADSADGDAQALAALAAALSSAPQFPALTPTRPSQASPSPRAQAGSGTATATLAAVRSATAPPAPTATPEATFTPRPSPTPSPTPGAPFVLAEQQEFCDENGPQGRLEIYVEDSAGQAVPGVQIVVSWNGGQDFFFTGLVPQVSPGYADFSMSPGVTYSLRAGEGGTPAGNLTAGTCTRDDGSSYLGGLTLRFRQP